MSERARPMKAKLFKGHTQSCADRVDWCRVTRIRPRQKELNTLLPVSSCRTKGRLSRLSRLSRRSLARNEVALSNSWRDSRPPVLFGPAGHFFAPQLLYAERSTSELDLPFPPWPAENKPLFALSRKRARCAGIVCHTSYANGRLVMSQSVERARRAAIPVTSLVQRVPVSVEHAAGGGCVPSEAGHTFSTFETNQRRDRERPDRVAALIRRVARPVA